jgi:HAE1 family hydrophobic/amphiphilic exporter-1
MTHPKTSRLVALGVLFSVAIPAPLVTNDFFDETDGGRQTQLQYHLDGTYSLEKVEEAVNIIEEYLYANQERFEIESVYSWFTPNEASSTLILKDGKDKNLDTEEIQALVEEGLPKLAIARPNFSWRQQAGGEASIRVTISGESSERLAELSEQVAVALDRVPGFKNAMSEARRGRNEIHISIDRERANQFGVSSEFVARTISAAMRGQNLRRFHTKDGEVEMRLQFQDADKQTVDDLSNLTVDRPDGPPMRLASLANIRMTTGPRGIYRENRSTMMGVHAKLDGIEPEVARERLSELLNSYDFPTGYSWSFGQRFDDEQNSQNIMLRNMLLALLLIYLVMAGLFESLIHPAAIWLSIAFAIVGVFWFFLVTNTSMSLMAMIGMLVLIGVVVNNGIVLVDHINHLRSEGMDRETAIVTAGRDRFRPIIMTAGTTILGLIPLCIGKTLIGGGGPPYFPMARAIVGGLAFSTVVTLVILPTIYVALDNLRYWGREVSTFASSGKKG